MRPVLALLPALAVTASLLAGMPEVGQPAPGFSAADASGRRIRLGDYQGTATVVLYFYPKDGTPGCTHEACSLRDGYDAILATGAVVLGVSADSAASHAAFAAEHHLGFPLLVDPDHTIMKAYGVFDEQRRMARRVTFIIGRDGRIKHVIQDVKPEEHDRQVLALLKVTS